MESHTIRLRGAWECVPVDGPFEPSTRRTLPSRGDSFPAGRLRFTRRFQRPPRIPGGPVILRLSRCAGILSVLLNGRQLGPISPEEPEYALDLGILEPWNELAIEADPPRNGAEWGVIGLVFESLAEGEPGVARSH